MYQAAKVHNILKNLTKHLPEEITALIQSDMTTEILEKYIKDSHALYHAIDSNDMGGYAFGTFRPSFAQHEK